MALAVGVSGMTHDFFLLSFFADYFKTLIFGATIPTPQEVVSNRSHLGRQEQEQVSGLYRWRGEGQEWTRHSHLTRNILIFSCVHHCGFPQLLGIHTTGLDAKTTYNDFYNYVSCLFFCFNMKQAGVSVNLLVEHTLLALF